jgi:hypothetical protein
VLGVLGGGHRATAAAGAGPTERVLDLDERRRQHVLRVRYQHRQLRSATAAAMAAPPSPGAVDCALVRSPTFLATVGDALAKELGEYPAASSTASPLTP